MAIDDWKDMFPAEVTIAEFTSRDSYGNPGYGTPATYNAREVYKPTKVVTPGGQEVVARGVVWVQGTPTIDPQDQLTLSDGTSPPILAVDRISDESGSHHIKLYFGGV